jgi:hypothetical protein
MAAGLQDVAAGVGYDCRIAGLHEMAAGFQDMAAE